VAQNQQKIKTERKPGSLSIARLHHVYTRGKEKKIKSIKVKGKTDKAIPQGHRGEQCIRPIRDKSQTKKKAEARRLEIIAGFLARNPTTSGEEKTDSSICNQPHKNPTPALKTTPRTISTAIQAEDFGNGGEIRGGTKKKKKKKKKNQKKKKKKKKPGWTGVTTAGAPPPTSPEQNSKPAKDREKSQGPDKGTLTSSIIGTGPRTQLKRLGCG